MSSSGTEPATFRLVEQCLNQLRYRMPPKSNTYLAIGPGKLTAPEKSDAFGDEGEPSSSRRHGR
jgi:hypothetical protein